MKPIEKQGKYLDVDTALGLSQITVLLNELFYGIAYDVFCDPVPSTENRAVWIGALAEFSDYCLKIYDAYIVAEAAEGEPMNDEASISAAQFFRENFVNPKILTAPGELGTKQLAAHAMFVLKRFVERETSLAEYRALKKQRGVLAGKVVSQPNHDELTTVTDSLEEEMKSHQSTMKECVQSLRDFLAKFDPKSNTANADDVNSRQKKLRAIRMKQFAIDNN
jgi:hypothetical protein